MPVDVALKHATSEEHTCLPYVSPSPLEGGPAFYPGVLARGAGTRDPFQASADSPCSDLYPFTPSDDLLQAPSLTSHTSKKWAEASRIRSTPPLSPLQSSASSGPRRCHRRVWKALDSPSLWLGGDEGRRALCSFWGTPEEPGGCAQPQGSFSRACPKT